MMNIVVTYQTVVISALVGIVPAVILGWWLLQRSQKQKTGIGSRLFFVILFWGVLTAIPASVFQIININSGGSYLSVITRYIFLFNDNYFVSQIFWPMVVVGVIEELSKGLGIILALRSVAKSPRARQLKINPGLLVGILVGLAFGITENGVYFANNFVNQIGGEQLIQIVVLRFILSTSAHMIYSGFFGAFLVDGLVAKQFVKKIIFFALMIFVPIGLHTLFDVIVSTDYGMLSIPLIIFGISALTFKAFWK